MNFLFHCRTSNLEPSKEKNSNGEPGHKMNYDEIIEKMEMQIKIASTESAQVIYTHLMIYGKMTYSELIDKLNYSRGTVFNSLKLLQDAGYVEKGEDPEIQDKRKNVFYYSKEYSIEINTDINFVKYLLEKGKLGIYKEYLKSNFTVTTTKLKSAISIPHERTIQKIESLEKGESLDKILKESNKSPRPSLFYYEIKSMKNYEKLLLKLKNCIDEFEEEVGEGRDYTKPLDDPIAFSVVFYGL